MAQLRKKKQQKNKKKVARNTNSIRVPTLVILERRQNRGAERRGWGIDMRKKMSSSDKSVALK